MVQLFECVNTCNNAVSKMETSVHWQIMGNAWSNLNRLGIEPRSQRQIQKQYITMLCFV